MLANYTKVSKIYFRLSLIILALSISSCKNFNNVTSESLPISHQPWDTLLKAHVDSVGKVNYEGFIRDSVQLNSYLNILSNGFPNAENWTENERMAYWINAYNAFTVQLIIRNYPLESIKDIGSTVAIPFINSVWDIAFFSVENQNLTLNNIEHSILRKEFNEPRIHFAINCASKSCPPLRTEAYTAEKLETQLKEQAILFINHLDYNQITEDEIVVSKIFFWFGGDFEKQGTLIDYLNKFSTIKISKDASVDFLDYNWLLNE